MYTSVDELSEDDRYTQLVDFFAACDPEEEVELQQCFCYSPRNGCTRKFITLDFVQDHTRSRYMNISFIVMLPFLVLFCKGYYEKASLNWNNNYVNNELGNNILHAFINWAITIFIALIMLCIVIPLFSATSPRQNIYMSYFITIPWVILIGIALVVFAQDFHKELPALHYTLVGVCCISFFACFVCTIRFLFIICRNPKTDYYHSKFLQYLDHVQRLYTPLEKIKVTLGVTRQFDQERLMSKLTCEHVQGGDETAPIKFHKMLENANDYYYPQRLITAFVVCVSVMIVMAAGGVDFYYYTRDIVGLVYIYQNRYQLQPYLIQTFNETYVQNRTAQIEQLQTLAFTGGLSAPSGVDDVILNATTDWAMSQVQLGYQLAYAVAISASIVTTLLLFTNWFFLFREFRKKLLQYRRGFYIEKPEKRLQNTTHYFGFQVMSTFVGGVLLYSLLSGIFFTIGFSVTNQAIRYFLANLIFPTLCAYILISLPISLIESYIITKKDGKELKKNFLFYIADCLFLAMHLLRGVILMPVRAALSILLLALYFPRLDVYVFPGEFKVFDWGSISFNSMVYLEHKYNNPIAVVFREILRKEIRCVKDDRQKNRPE